MASDLTDEEMAYIALSENRARRDLTSLEVITAWSKALEIEGVTIQVRTCLLRRLLGWLGYRATDSQMTHDPALCDRDVCARCDAYASGKDKAFFQVRAVLDACDHARGCGCEPCKLIRDMLDVVERMPAASARYGDVIDSPAPDSSGGTDEKVSRSNTARGRGRWSPSNSTSGGGVQSPYAK